MANPDDLVPKAARTEIFYFVARVCMLGATLIGFPLAGMLGTRLIAKADEISAQVLAQNIDLRLLSSLVQIQAKHNEEKLTDHEIRLRSIEKLK